MSISDISKLSTDQINNLIKQSTESLLCGPECQKNKKSELLHQGYLDAQSNVKTAPFRLKEAEKSYYTYTQGNAEYNKINETAITKQATANALSATTEFNTNIDNTKDLITTYNSLNNTYQNTNELYEKYLRENKDLQIKSNNINTDTVTNDRKSYYKSQEYDKLNSWYRLLKWIYIFLIIIYILGMFLSRSNYSILSKIGILIVLILYPFIINYIVVLIYNFYLTNNK